MKFLELEDEALFNSLADVVEPIQTIFSSPKVAKQWKDGNRTKAVIIVLREYQKEVKQALAALNGVPVEEFKCNFLSLANGVKEVIGNKELMDFFISLMQTLSSFGSAMESIEEVEKG